MISHLLRMASAIGLFSQIVIILGPYYQNVLQTMRDIATGVEWQSETDIVCIKNPQFDTTNNIYSLHLVRNYLNGDVVIHNNDVLVAPCVLPLALWHCEDAIDPRFYRIPVRKVEVDFDKIISARARPL
jgi:hypothetical protein